MPTPPVKRGAVARVAGGAVVGLLAAAAVLGLERAGALERAERTTRDWRQRALSRASGKPPVAFVYVGEPSLDASRKEDIPWPWPRGLWAMILDHLRAEGARAVAFDFPFAEPSPYREDDFDLALEHAIAGNARTFFGLALAEEPAKTDPKVLAEAFAGLVPVELEDPALARLFPEARALRSPTLPRFLAAARGAGHVRRRADADGVHRRLHPFVRFEDRLVPSLSLALAREALGGGPVRLGRDLVLEVGPPANRRRIPLERDGSMLLRFGPEIRAAHVSAIEAYAAVLAAENRIAQANIGDDAFRGKVAFVAHAAPSLGGWEPNPLLGPAPGVLVHAAATANLIEGRPLRSWTRGGPLPLALGAAALGALAGAIVAATPRFGRRAGAVLLLGAAWAVGAGLAFWQADLVVDVVAPEMAIGLAFAGATLRSYVREGRRRRLVKDVFRNRLSPSLVEDLLRDPAKLRLGGERRELTIFKSDVAGFAGIAEKLEPEEIVRRLNEYLTRMTRVVLAHGGTHDKYEGDAVLAFFGAPIPVPRHAAMACLAALEQQEEIARINAEWTALGLPALRARMGIATGEVVVGDLGSRGLMDYTVTGDAVNLVARLEGANKAFGTLTLVGERTVDLARDEIDFREIGGLRVKGRLRPMKIYEILGRKGRTPPAVLESARIFEGALRLYEKRDFARAAKMFEALKEQGDKPSEAYLEECRRFEKEPPPADWDGVIALSPK